MKTASRGFTLIELMVVIAIIAILSALAIPTFMGMQARSKQAEVMVNLKSLFTIEKVFLQQKDRYTSLVKELGFAPERGNRYRYNLATTFTPDDRTTANTTVTRTANAIDFDVFAGFGLGTGASAATAVTAGVCGGNNAWGLTNRADGTAVFTAGAQANIDSDSTLDLWSISTDSRALTGCNTSPASINAPGGVPVNESDDVSQ